MSIANHIDGSYATLAVVNLYRRLHDQNHASNKDFKYLLFGYYDGMDFEIVHSLEKLFKEDYYRGKKDLNQIYEIQRLCLYTRQANENEIRRFIREVDEMPLLVVTEIKINEKVLVTQEISSAKISILDELQEKITRNIDSFIQKRDIKHLQYRVFLSLGYSEFVVFFRTNNYQDVVHIINDIRSSSYQPSSTETKNIPFLRSTYSSAGVELRLVQTLPTYPVDISLRFSFKRTVDLAAFKRKILETLQLGQDQVDKDQMTFQTLFGKYDLGLQLRKFPINRFISIFHNYGQATPQPILDPEHPFRKDIISHTDTHWLLELADNHEYNIINHQSKEKNIDGDIILANQYLASPSIQLAYTQLVKSYYKIAMDGASEPALIYELRGLILGFSKQVKEDRKRIFDKTEGDERDEELAKHYNQMGLGIRLMVELLQSRVQAFRFFSEVPTYNQQFIRSSTKIFVAYITLIEAIEIDLKKLYKKTSPKKHAHEITFFATLEYREKVTSFDLFPETKFRLIPIVLNPGFFLDIHHNILLIMHEVSHYIPSPNRMTRNELFCKLVCKSIAEEVFFMILTGEDQSIVQNFELSNSLMEKVHNSLSDFFIDQIWNKGEVIDKESSMRFFPDCLSEQIEKTFSLEDENVVNNYQELIDYIDKIILRGDSDLLAQLKDVAKGQVEKIHRGENLLLLNELWNWRIKQISENKAINESEENDLNRIWGKLNQSAKDRKEQLILQGLPMIEKDWFPSIQSLIASIKSEPNEPNLALLSHLTARHMNENVEVNRKIISEDIIRFMLNPEVKDEIINKISLFEKLFIEARADYFMCKLLNLQWDHYDGLISFFKNNSKYSLNEDSRFQLEFRRFILSKTTLYNNQKVIIDPETDNLAEGMFLSLIAKYLDDLKSEDDFPLNVIHVNEIHGKCLKYLQEYYRHSLNNGANNRNIEEINLIEQLWNLGVNLFDVKGENDS